MMKRISMIAAAMLLAGGMVPKMASACDAAGEHTHVGQVLSVDGHTFTIRDAQSGGPISFTANKKMQGSMPAPGDSIAVKYSGEAKQLIAESVQ